MVPIFWPAAFIMLRRDPNRLLSAVDLRPPYSSGIFAPSLRVFKRILEKAGLREIRIHDIYGTWIPNSNRSAVNRLDSLLVDDQKEIAEEKNP